MSKKTTATKDVAVAPSAELLAQLGESFPMDDVTQRIFLPRLSMASQDVTEGKGKNLKVIYEAGTFFTEKQTDKKDPETKKPIWEKTEIGSDVDVVIFFQRKQLSYYDEATEEYTSSPVFDTDEEVIPLFCKGKQVSKGTMSELQDEYEYTDKEGKVRSKLECQTILYVKYEGEIYQMNMRGSSGWSFSSYKRALQQQMLPVPAVVTRISSEFQEKGKITWNKATFENVRNLSAEEAQEILADITDTKNAISIEKKNYGKATELDEEEEEETKELPSGKKAKNDF